MTTEQVSCRRTARRRHFASQVWPIRSGTFEPRPRERPRAYLRRRVPQLTTSASVPAGASELKPLTHAATGCSEEDGSGAGESRTSATQTAIDRAKMVAAGCAMGSSDVGEGETKELAGVASTDEGAQSQQRLTPRSRRGDLP